jgi:hypothetical protein
MRKRRIELDEHVALPHFLAVADENALTTAVSTGCTNWARG